MATKHTPQPWTIKFLNEQCKDDGKSDFFVHGPNEILHYGTEIMMEDFGEHNGYPREQKLADAKLISAAPELLDACMATKAFFDDMPKGQFGKIVCNIGLMNDMFIALENATKKAV